MESLKENPFVDGELIDVLSQVESERSRGLSVVELYLDVARVAGVLGSAPSEAEYAEEGLFSTRTVRRSFGEVRWTQLMIEFGYEPTWGMGSKGVFVDDIRRVGRIVDGVPSREEYVASGRFSVKAVERFCPLEEWERIILVEYPDAELVADISRVAELFGRPPTAGEYDCEGVVTTQTVADRLGEGSWPVALGVAGYPVGDRRAAHVGE